MRLPDGWKLVPIKEICSCIVDCVNKTAPIVDYETPYKMIRTTNVRHGRIDTKNVRYVTEETYKIWTRRGNLENGDLIFTREAPVGEIGVLEDANGVFLGQRTVMYRAHLSKSNNLFILYSLQSRYCEKQIEDFSNGGTVAHVRVPDCSEIILKIPPLPEQQKIAQILSTWDKAIEKLDALIAAKQKRKKAMMQQLLTGKMRFAGFDGEWKKIAIKQMGKVVSGGTPDTNNGTYWNGEILWMTPTDVTSLQTRFITNTKRKITEDGIKNSSATVIPKGSLLVCTRATIGLMSISTTDITTNQGFKNLIPNAKFNVDFLYYLFNFFKKDLIRYACGSTFFELSKQDFEKIDFECPELAEQQKIASVLSAADNEIETHQKQLSSLKEQKKGLMQQLLTGKKRVRV